MTGPDAIQARDAPEAFDTEQVTRLLQAFVRAEFLAPVGAVSGFVEILREDAVRAGHTGYLDDLDRIIRQRAAAPPEESYTAKLIAGGPARPAKKLGEEAVEAAIAAVQGDRDGLTAEAADVLYHLLVLLAAGEVPLGAVMAELERRTAQGGLAEKASRRPA